VVFLCSCIDSQAALVCLAESSEAELGSQRVCGMSVLVATTTYDFIAGR
jgi:hypothetical protein